MKSPKPRLIFTAFVLVFSLFLLTVAPTYASLDYVGDMFPTGGSTTTVGLGADFDVYISAYKSGLTDSPPEGQSPGITCTLRWGQVTNPNDPLGAYTDTPMVYVGDVAGVPGPPNNDRYKGTFTPATTGYYRFTSYCTHDSTSTFQSGGLGTVQVNAAAGISGARAVWLDQNDIGWNGTNGASYRLLYDLDGNMDLLTASSIPLTPSGTVSGFPQYPNWNGKTKLTINPADYGLIATILKGEIVVAAYNGGDTLIDATRVQLSGVLDNLYTYTGTLGVSWSGTTPTLRVWAPTAQSVSLHRYEGATTTISTTVPMTFDAPSGTWSVTGDASWQYDYYTYDVQVYVPSEDEVLNNIVTDPYSLNLSQNSQRSQIIDLYNDASLEPTGWDNFTKPPLNAPEDIIVYEMHIRDFSINDSSVAPAHRGTYRAFTYDGLAGPNPNTALSDGMAHILELEEAGLTHVHMLPAFDIASVNEDATARTDPDPTLLETYAPDSIQQQQAVSTTRFIDSFNWGYDPYHYGVPEGSYATVQNDTTRIVEFREMVQTLNQNGLRVVMDVVYNHTAASGQASASVFDKIVPGYYYRYNTVGDLQQSSCCADTAVEFAMMDKLMVDTVRMWAVAYRVDAFRFDLMNLHTKSAALEVRAELDSLTIGSDGVDGDSIFMYGEGWDFGSAKEKGLLFASQFNMAGTGIATFNDRIRDSLHGGYSGDDIGIRAQGWLNGLYYDCNSYGYNPTCNDVGYFRYIVDRLKISLAGGLQNYVITDQNGGQTTGIQLNGTGYTLDPGETINYVEKHDNETLYDQNIFKMPTGSTTMDERIRAQNMGVSVVGLAQGIPFFHMGQDILRSKSLDRNTYDSGDWFNRVFWDQSQNNFGSGLPPAWDNQTRWDIMQPLLADTSLQPSSTQIEQAAAHFREILRIRSSSVLFRLRTAADVQNRVNFFNNGAVQANSLIVMGLNDGVGADLDSSNEYILVLFNSSDDSVTFTDSILSNLNFMLHPVHLDAQDADSVVQSTTYTNGTGTFTIPPRTTAVFVSNQSPTFPGGPDYVGTMYPVGGTSTPWTQGTPGNLRVYVQVYEPGVTTTPNQQGAGIQCFLQWGDYGQAFSDIPMTYNGGFGGANNDEYYADIPAGTLAVGTYGYTAYCTYQNGTLYRATPYGDSNGDGGDGILSVIPIPANDPKPAPAGGVFVHLFEWKWSDIQKECMYLAEQGYTGVQVSPPQEHIPPFLNGSAEYPWYVRYQPVSYELVSRSGSAAEFEAMVEDCNEVGVDIYVDVVINHMTGRETGAGNGTGTAGSTYSHYDYEAYDPDDFHYCGTLGTGDDQHNIMNYSRRYQVQTCELLNLADLDTGDPAVRDTIRAYLQSLLDLGVAGFRLDAAKHIAAHEIEAIFTGLTGEYYLFQEAIDINGSGEPIEAYEYVYVGDVTEFNYSQLMGRTFNGCGSNLAELENVLNTPAYLNSAFAQVFVDNHDNQRGHGPGGNCIVDHRDGHTHVLANIFTLAYPYGYPSVMSSYHWDTDNNGENDEAGPPSTTAPNTAGSGPNTLNVYGPTQVPGDVPENCNATLWVCEHRRTATANMVEFRQVTDGEPVNNWWDNNANVIAFGRGTEGYVAISREAAFGPTTRNWQTSLAAGLYCDVTKGKLLPTNSCSGPSIEVDNTGLIANYTLNGNDAFAIHSGARIAPLSVTLANFTAEGVVDGVQVTWETVSESDNAGFNLYRATTPDVGAATRLNDELIPSQSPGGGIYEWLDDHATSGVIYYYWLEAVNTDGVSTQHGPVSAQAGAPTAIAMDDLTTQNERSGTMALWFGVGLVMLVAAGVILRRRS